MVLYIGIRKEGEVFMKPVQDKRPYPRVAGAGVELVLQMRNRPLVQTFKYTFERVDNQLAMMATAAGAGEEVKKLRVLLDEQEAALDKSLAQLKKITEDNGVKVRYTGKPTELTAVVLTPYSHTILSLFKKSDDAIAQLHALWAIRLVDEDKFREQTHKLRARIHNACKAVSTLYTQLFKKDKGGDASSDAASDGAGESLAEEAMEPEAA